MEYIGSVLYIYIIESTGWSIMVLFYVYIYIREYRVKYIGSVLYIY